MDRINGGRGHVCGDVGRGHGVECAVICRSLNPRTLGRFRDRLRTLQMTVESRPSVWLIPLPASPHEAAAHAGETIDPRRIGESGRALRGFNPIDLEDLNVFRAVLRGEHAILGFKNRDIRRQLYPDRHPSESQRTLGARVSRSLKRLHVRSLIAKIPRSHRWRVTRLGNDLMAAALHVREIHFFHALTQPAPA